MKPVKVSQADLIFGARNIEKLLPKYEDIPEEFKEFNSNNKWVKLQELWFFKGIPDKTIFFSKEGIDPEEALRHLTAIQKSWEPQHEHKSAGVAYLFSLWFENYKLPTTERQIK